MKQSLRRFSASFATEQDAGHYVVRYYDDLAKAYANKDRHAMDRYHRMARDAAKEYGVE